MGNTASTEGVATSLAPATTPEKPGEGIKLYEYVRGTTAGTWELTSENARPNFYNLNEDNEEAPPKWYLEIDAGGIDDEVHENYEFLEPQRRVTFIANDKIWAMKFPTAATFAAFFKRHQDVLFENTFGVENDDAGRAKALGKDTAALFGKESEESRMQWEAEVEEDKRGPESYHDRGTALSTTPSRIHGVKMGAGTNSYLVRDKEVEVMRNVRGGVEETGFTFNLTPQRSGAAPLTPSKVLLTKGERQMNMLTPAKRNAVVQTHIETGKIMHEWTFQKDGVDIPMLDIENDSKSAQLDLRDTFLGLDKNRLCRWDMRTPNGVAQQLNSPVVGYVGGKDYAGKPRFSCMKAAGDGSVVVGSEDGTLRLYSEKTLTRASTAIPGLGLPITSVDVTYDAQWVVATTRNYLMVIKTAFIDKMGKATTGFKGRMGASAPAPRLLRLKTEDVGLVGHAPLEKGHFEWRTESGKQERWIVASCGNYTVLWSFGQVKRTSADVVSFGGLTTCTAYHLIPKQEHVVDSVFMHDNYAATPSAAESAMVVVTDNCVWTVGGEDEDED